LLKEILKSFYHKHYRFKRFRVLGRTACLGNEIIKQMGWNKNYINHQKSRVDYLIELHKDKNISPNPKEIIKYLKHKFIIGTIKQQKNNFFDYQNPDIIVMDSFSELTDQLFVNINTNQKFLANYSDINHSLLPNYYKCNGLIEDNLLKTYDDFFSMVSLKYSNIPLYFIHFSTVLDNRDKFKNRGEMILKIIDQLSIKYSFINIIKVNGALVSHANTDNEEFNSLPYHYSANTYKEYVLKFQKIYQNAES
jgi:hypothetical protein